MSISQGDPSDKKPEALAHLRPLAYPTRKPTNSRVSIDGVLRPGTHQRRSTIAPIAASRKPSVIEASQKTSQTLEAVTPSTPEAIQKNARLPRIANTLQPFLIVFGAMVLGLAVQAPGVGEALLVAYGIFVFVRRVPSRTTFFLAFLLSLFIVILLAVKTNNHLAATFSIYVFLLLVIGTAKLAWEVRGS